LSILMSIDDEYGQSNTWPLGLRIFPDDLSVSEIVAAALDPDDLVKMAADFERCGSSPAVFAKLGQRGRATGESKHPTFLVDGLLQNGVVTVLTGRRSVGKSTLAHELAIAAATPWSPGERPLTWIGRELATRSPDAVVAYLSGEDGEGDFAKRGSRLDPKAKADGLFMLNGNKGNLQELLGLLRGVPSLSLVVVDPVRAFMDGNEDQSGAVSAFFDSFVSLAEEKGCAVILLHHMGKNSKIRNAMQMTDMMRGSGVFGDRPRLVLGMFTRYNRTIVGIAKSNLIDVAEGTEFVLTRDAETLRHIPSQEAGRPERVQTTSEKSAAKASSRKNDAPAAPEPEVILGALAHFTTKGEPVTKTGLKELYERRASYPELGNFSRRATRRAVEDLIEEGRIVLDGGWLTVAGQMS
jgi:hypothetical protein